MRNALRIAALVIVLTGLGAWLGLGVNVGWTKTSKQIDQIDPVTELTYPTYKPGFYPGIDFVLAVVLTGMGLFGASFAVRRRGRFNAYIP